MQKYFHLLKDIKYQRIRQNTITQIINQKINAESKKIQETAFKQWKRYFQIARNGKNFIIYREQAQLKELFQFWRIKLQTRQKQKTMLYKILVSKKDNLIKYAFQQWRKNQSYNKFAQKECQILNWFSEQQQKQKLVPIRLENSSSTSTSFMSTTQRNGNVQQYQTQRPPLYSDKKYPFANNQEQATHRSIKSIDMSSVQMHGTNFNKNHNLQSNSFNNDYSQREAFNGDLIERDYSQSQLLQQQQQQFFMNNSFNNNSSNNNNKSKHQDVQGLKSQNYQSLRRDDNGQLENNYKNLEIIRENQQHEISYQHQQSERKQNDEQLNLQENKNQQSKQYKVQELRIKIQNNNLELQEKIQEYNDLKTLQLENDKDLVAYMKTLKEDIKKLIENSKELKHQLIALQ
ncbi:hypothetical protein ABPG73_005430 [Tetrahymena malaccensis]